MKNRPLLKQATRRIASTAILLASATAALEAAPDSPYNHLPSRATATSLLHLEKRGELKSAQRLALKHAAQQRQETEVVLTHSGESERQNYLQSLSPYDHLASLQLLPELANAVLAYKNLLSDSLTEDIHHAKSSANPVHRATSLKIQKLKQEHVQADFGNRAYTHANELQSLQAELAQAHPQNRASLSVKLADVQSALAQEEVLIEFIRFKNRLGKNTAPADHYGALIIDRQRATPKWIDFGPAAIIDTKIESLNYLSKAMAEEYVAQKQQAFQLSQLRLTAQLKSLSQTFWNPISARLSRKVSTLYLSPDSNLHHISFATLIDSRNHFVGENYQCLYLASGRDLLKATPSNPRQQFVAFANPLYDIANLHAPQTETISHAGLAETPLPQLNPLPSFCWDAYKFGKRLSGWGWEYQVFVGLQATEHRLAQFKSPLILHIGTHGYSIPNADRVPMASHAANTLQEKPTYRSGLMLAHAGNQLKATRNTTSRAARNDGILTAEETSLLQLEKTQLVVLMACQSGAGETKPNGGLPGLRQSFAQAGAQNVLSSLWPLVTGPTSLFIDDFYLALNGSLDFRKAFARTQPFWLRKLRKTQGHGYAAFVAGPFILNVTGD